MTPTLAVPVTHADRRLEAFALADDHGPRAVARFLPAATDPDYRFVLCELVRADMAFFAAAGAPRRLDDYRAAFPELGTAVAHATDLTRTPAPPAARFGDSHPADPAAFPEPGATFDGYVLREELGRGGFGRVYLAEEERLGGRRVVLKITNRPNNEPVRMARLQHTNIVPVYTTFRVGPQFALQMPYFGRQTLADLIDFVRDDGNFPAVPGRVFSTTAARLSTSRGPRSGSRPAAPADAPTPFPFAAAKVAAGVAEPHPIRDMLARKAYPDAVLWLMTRLADGLAHAHARGILHLDLKPQNVLFSDDGQPMLLDFNLSFDVARKDRDRVGGTWPYMAPEQILEYTNQPGGGVDERSDLFGLGVIFYELLACGLPFPPPRAGPGAGAAAIADRLAGPPPLRERNPDVSPAVDAVVRKLLAPAPADRYQSAEDLKADLERHAADRPLLYAPNPSLVERAAKWRRRNPRAVSYTLLAAAVAAAAGLGGVAFHSAEAVAVGRAQDQARAFRDAAAGLRIDLAAPTDPAARRAAVAAADNWLARFGPDADADPNLRNLDPAAREAVTRLLGEISLLAAQADIHDGRDRGGDDRAAAFDRAAARNRAAEKWFGPGGPAVVAEQRHRIAPAGDAPPAPAPGVGTPTDLYVRAVAQIADGQFRAAAENLVALTAAERDHAAGHFALAYCYQQAGQYARALERYTIARAAAPADPRPSFNRGLIYLSRNTPVLAEAEFDEALRRAPHRADAYWFRAAARSRRGDFDGAADDLDRAALAGYSAFGCRLARCDVNRQRARPDEAAADRAAADRLGPQTAADYVARGNARVLDRDPAALADFDAALALAPRTFAAWQNKARVLADAGELTAALDAQTRAAEVFPEFGPARMGKALLLARAGRRTEAHAEAVAALALSDDAQVTYQAANVYAITAAEFPEDRPAAYKHLRAALRGGYRNFAAVQADRDMAAIRGSDEFRHILAAARELAGEK